MADQDVLAREFEEHRTHLRSVAYRVLGDRGLAEEATQVLEDASRGSLTITSLAEESRPPAATADGQH